MARKETAFEKAQRLMNEKGLTAEQAASRTGVNVGRLQPSTTSMTINGFTPQTSQVVSGTPYDSPTGAYTTYQTQLPGGQQAYSQNKIGAAGQQYLADYLAGNTTGSFADWQAAGGYQGGGQAAPAAAPAATGGGGGKKKQKKDISDKGLKAQLKIYGADNKIGGKEYKKLTAQGYTPEQITKRLDVLNQNKGLKIGLGSNVLNKIGKEIAADPFSAISIPGAGNVAARGFGEGKLGQAIKQLAGGTEAPGQLRSPAPAPNQLLKPEPGTVGAGGIQPGQVLRAGGQVGTRQPTRAERQLANQGAIGAAPNVTQPAADMTAGADMTEPAAGGDFGLGDLGVKTGPSASDQALLDALSGLNAPFGDPIGGDLFGDIFGGLDANDPITADILRRYGVGRNYNIDAIRAALRSRMGRRSYLRSSLDSGASPLRSALSFAPVLGGLTAGMGGVGI